jgi:biotin-(acetyl-CoA carboxylase) ligase
MGRRSKSGEAPATHPTTSLAAAEELSRQLDRWVAAAGKRVLDAWRERDALRGREIRWDGGPVVPGLGSAGAEGERSGVADGVDERGSLVVVTAGGERVALGAGEVHLLL